MPILFVPGLGLGGRAVWPLADNPALRGQKLAFLEHREKENLESQIRNRVHSPTHLVAHAAGAQAALNFASISPDLVKSLVLFEPACFGMARGGVEVESLVERMEPVFKLSSTSLVSDGLFALQFFLALEGPSVDPNQKSIIDLGRRLRSEPPPWEASASPDVFTKVPTLVVSGQWNSLYEEVANHLSSLGAEILPLPGFSHRPQDHPEALNHLLEFWSR